MVSLFFQTKRALLDRTIQIRDFNALEDHEGPRFLMFFNDNLVCYNKVANPVPRLDRQMHTRLARS